MNIETLTQQLEVMGLAWQDEGEVIIAQKIFDVVAQLGMINALIRTYRGGSDE